MNFQEFLELKISIGKFEIALINILLVIFILAAARLTVWLAKRLLLPKFYARRKVDVGRQYAFTQFIVYFVYVGAVIWAMETLGMSLSVLLASSAALLVGIGLGLQDTFKDLVSGFVILVEGTVEVGDVIEVDGLVARVKRIGLRTSEVETRNNNTILIPNSKIIGEKVTNYTANDLPTKFSIRVGVAYKSDLDQVKKLMVEAVKKHPKILETPEPGVELINFGDSSLDMELDFFSNEVFRIEPVLSAIRFEIARLFRENGVEIPFPQREV
ncbi:MAG: mechanosensitive ion channel domain-containing protein, partial [Bacteroidota bacterium]